VVVDTVDFSCGDDVVVLVIGLGFGRDFDETFVSLSWLDSTLESLKLSPKQRDGIQLRAIRAIIRLHFITRHTRAELLFRLRLVDTVDCGSSL